MSDIPIGSPPVPPGRHAAPGGWYPDPVDSGSERYWDGWQWSRTTRPAENGSASGVHAYPGPRPPVPAGQASSDRPYPGPSTPYPYAPGPTGVRPTVTTADGVPVSGWWWRVLATLIDNLITSVVVAVLGFSLYRSMIEALSTYFNDVLAAARAGAAAPPSPGTTDLISATDQALLTALSLAVGLAYHVTFLRLKSATPGKLICGLRVVPVDHGRAAGPLAWNAVVIRAAIWVLPGVYGLLGLFQLVDALFPLWHPKRQALHDLAAKTQVVRPSAESR